MNKKHLYYVNIELMVIYFLNLQEAYIPICKAVELNSEIINKIQHFRTW